LFPFGFEGHQVHVQEKKNARREKTVVVNSIFQFLLLFAIFSPF
jgi:hypothetical protein